MRILLIKTSSMGDVLHTLPALTDAQSAIPSLKVDWVIEEDFKEIPGWHPTVNKIFPIAFRRWRKQWFARETQQAWRQFYQAVRAESYDLILDAQGLAKSALLAFFAKGTRAGLDFHSAREFIAALAYQRKYEVNFYQHAVKRMRLLFSQALNYPLPDQAPDFGLDPAALYDEQWRSQKPYFVFLHGTTWTTKQWPEAYWMALAKLVAAAGYNIKIGGASNAEIERAMRIAQGNPAVEVIPRLSIDAMAKCLANSQGAVAVDTGFGHLAAALNLPIVSIYGPTNPVYTGALGPQSIHLAADFPCAPCLSRDCHYKKTSVVTPACYEDITPDKVWATLQRR